VRSRGIIYKLITRGFQNKQISKVLPYEVNDDKSLQMVKNLEKERAPCKGQKGSEWIKLRKHVKRTGKTDKRGRHDKMEEWMRLRTFI
jgi:hypothetical protein